MDISVLLHVNCGEYTRPSVIASNSIFTILLSQGQEAILDGVGDFMHSIYNPTQMNK